MKDARLRDLEDEANELERMREAGDKGVERRVTGLVIVLNIVGYLIKSGCRCIDAR